MTPVAMPNAPRGVPRRVVLAACFAVTPGATLLTPRAAVESLPVGPTGGSGGRRGAPLPSAPAPGPQAQAQARLSVVDWNAYDERETDGPGTYSFGYEIEDPSSGNTQFRQEERFANGTVVGSYGLVEPDGNVRVVSYVADALGYRARVENSLRKNENFPRTATATAGPGPGRPRRPEWSASDRLLGGGVPQAAAVEVFPVQPQQQQLQQLAPLQWAVQSLQDGRRTPVQEQRLRPASAPRRHASEMDKQYAAHQQQQQQYLQQQQQYIQQQQQYLRQLQQQQQQQDRRTGQGYASVEQQQQQHYGLPSTAVQYDDVSNSLGPEEELYRREQAVDNRRSDGAVNSWSSEPIVVWPTPGASAPAPAGVSAPSRRQLPPIPLLDKLIYQQ